MIEAFWYPYLDQISLNQQHKEVEKLEIRLNDIKYPVATSAQITFFQSDLTKLDAKAL